MGDGQSVSQSVTATATGKLTKLENATMIRAKLFAIVNIQSDQIVEIVGIFKSKKEAKEVVNRLGIDTIQVLKVPEIGKIWTWYLKTKETEETEK